MISTTGAAVTPCLVGFVGLEVGVAEGFFVFTGTGDLLGLEVGTLVGFFVGCKVGSVGALEGLRVGSGVGDLLGFNVGSLVGFFVGSGVGSREGLFVRKRGVGAKVTSIGEEVGETVGLSDCSVSAKGEAVGDEVGAR